MLYPMSSSRLKMVTQKSWQRREAGLPAPEFRQSGGQFIQTVWRVVPAVTGQVTGQVTTEVRLARALKGEMTRPGISGRFETVANIKRDRPGFRHTALPKLQFFTQPAADSTPPGAPV